MTSQNDAIQMAMRTSLKLRDQGADLVGDYVINIGSHDGKSMDDPCFTFYEQLESPGLCMDAGQHPSIHENLPWERVRKHMGIPVAPGNIIPFLRSEATPTECHFLKIDIDGFDAQILKRILQNGFEFDIIQIEVNPEFPPPIHFAVHFHPMFTAGGRTGFYGASISYIAAYASNFGYVPLEVDMESPSHDLLLINERHVDHFVLKSLHDLFFEAKAGHSHFFFNLGIDCSSWRDRQDYDYLLAEMWNVVSNASRIKNGDVLPFTLDIPFVD